MVELAYNSCSGEIFYKYYNFLVKILSFLYVFLRYSENKVETNNGPGSKKGRPESPGGLFVWRAAAALLRAPRCGVQPISRRGFRAY